MLLGIDPKVDFAFKWLFSRQGSKPIVIDLIHATLNLPVGDQIVDIEILNPFTEKSAADDKLSILDIKARDARGRYYNIEMQMVGFPALLQRVLFYWAKVYTEQLHEGEDYRLLMPTISICFVDSVILPAVSDYHTSFQITEREHGIVFTEDLQIHILELPKFNKTASEVTTALDRWLYFLRHAQEMDRSSLPGTMDTLAIRQAMEGLMTISQTDIEREIYEGRIKARRDERARQYAYEAAQAATEEAQAATEAAQAARDAMEAERNTQSARAEAETARATRAMEQLSQLMEQLAQAEQKGELVERITNLQRARDQEFTARDELRSMSIEDLERLAETLAQQLPHR